MQPSSRPFAVAKKSSTAKKLSAQNLNCLDLCPSAYCQETKQPFDQSGQASFHFVQTVVYSKERMSELLQVWQVKKDFLLHFVPLSCHSVQVVGNSKERIPEKSVLQVKRQFFVPLVPPCRSDLVIGYSKEKVPELFQAWQVTKDFSARLVRPFCRSEQALEYSKEKTPELLQACQVTKDFSAQFALPSSHPEQVVECSKARKPELLQAWQVKKDSSAQLVPPY